MGFTQMDEIQKQHEQMLYPIARVGAKDAGGSGTTIYSNKGQTYVLTNHHVIDSLYEWDERPNPQTGKMEYIESRSLGKVDYFLYDNLSDLVGTVGHKATLEAYDDQEDLALIKLQTKKEVEHVAKMYPRGKEDDIHIFDKCWTVGCSLGHSTIFTEGFITGKSDEIDDKNYFMANSGSVYGNSGGAVFVNRENEYQFIGVPSRISVVGFGSPITFMGYFIPPDRVYNFLEKQQFQFIYDDRFTPEESERRRKILKDKKKEVLEDLLNKEFEEGI